MEIILSQSSKTPLYAQIKRQIKQQILSGDLKEGTALPSMRTLAKELNVSVITTKRVYEELEAEGFLFSTVGKGTFVAGQQTHILTEWRMRELENQLETIIREGKKLGLSKKDFHELIAVYFKGAEEE